MTYTITTPVPNQPIPSSGFGIAVRNAILDLDSRVATLEAASQSLLARGRRITSTAGVTTTETGFLRIDNIPVLAGKVYQFLTTNMNVDTTVSNDIADVRLRLLYSASPGSPATTSSTQICHMRNTVDDATQSNVLPLNGFYVPSADGYISVLLSVVRVSGSGSIVVFCSGSEILDFTIQDIGTDPGDTGVVI